MSSASAEVAIAAAAQMTAVLRGLIDLWHYRVRRVSVKRVAASAVPGAQVVDRDADGAVMDMTISSDAAQPPSRSVLMPDNPQE